MAESIRITPSVCQEVGNHHDEVADQIRGARQAGADISAAVASCGPIMHQFKAAVADVLADRDTALLDHEETHRAAASALRIHAHGVEATEADNERQLRL